MESCRVASFFFSLSQSPCKAGSGDSLRVKSKELVTQTKATFSKTSKNFTILKIIQPKCRYTVYVYVLYVHPCVSVYYYYLLYFQDSQLTTTRIVYIVSVFMQVSSFSLPTYHSNSLFPLDCEIPCKGYYTSACFIL